MIDAIDEKKYGRLPAKYLPGVIRSDDEHDRLAGSPMKFALADERPAEEQRPVELLERLVEKGGLKQVDLLDCFGSQSVVSAVMAGKRQIKGGHTRRLSRRFGLPLAMFIR